MDIKRVKPLSEVYGVNKRNDKNQKNNGEKKEKYNKTFGQILNEIQKNKEKEER